MQEDMPKYKNPSRSFLLLGDFNARTATLDDCLQLDGISKTYYVTCSWGKIRKNSNLFVKRIAIERVDTFYYLGNMFISNNTFEDEIKNKFDKAKKCAIQAGSANE